MRNKEQIKLIMNDFDFKKIHSTMKFLNWKWSYENGEKKVPTVSDLISVAEFCLNKVANSTDDSTTFNVGGFEADKKDNMLELRFILEKVNPLSSLFNPDTKNELERKS